MYKIKAKQLLKQNGTAVPVKLFALSLTGLFGLTVFCLSVFALYNKKVYAFVSAFVPGYAKTVVAVLSVFGCAAGLLLFAFAKKKRIEYALLVVSGERIKSNFLTTARMLFCLLLKGVFYILNFMFFLIPFAASVLFMILSLRDGFLTRKMLDVWLCGNAVLFVLGIAFTLITLQRYSAWKYYVLNGESVFRAKKMSAVKTDGMCVKIALFKLSMLGWFALCLLVFPVFYVLPYYELSFYLLLTGEDEAEEKQPEEYRAVFRVAKPEKKIS